MRCKARVNFSCNCSLQRCCLFINKELISLIILFSGSNKTAEYRAGFHHCAAEISRNLTCVNGADQLRSKMLSHLAQSCCQGDSQETPAPVSTIGATSSTLPPETTSLCTTTTLAPIWVPYPSPPPSPVYGSPSEFPAQSPRSPSLECATFKSISTVATILHHEVNKSTSHSSTKKAQVWRPWEKHTVVCYQQMFELSPDYGCNEQQNSILSTLIWFFQEKE